MRSSEIIIFLALLEAHIDWRGKEALYGSAELETLFSVIIPFYLNQIIINWMRRTEQVCIRFKNWKL